MLEGDELQDEEACVAALRRLNNERAAKYDSWSILDPQQRPIPEHIIPGIARYVVDGSVPGGFLTAMLTNDLRGAIQSADDQNIKALPAIWNFLYNVIPSASWGSPEKMAKWVEQRKALANNPF